MKLLVYDGRCPFCEAMSRHPVRWGWLPEAARRPDHSFTVEEAERLRTAGIDRQLVVLDERTGEARGGIAGLLWLMAGTGWRPVARILGLPPLRGLLELAYRLVAKNRLKLWRGRCDGACRIDG